MTKRLNCILLIDDDEDDNYFHQFVIQKMNIVNDCQIAESGTDALEMLTEKKIAPDLIFLDLNMPRMNGWEFLEHYNKNSELKKRPVIIIVLTTSVNNDEKERCGQMPCISGFRSKPITEAMIHDIVAAHF